MVMMLDALDVDTLRWVLRCYLADRASIPIGDANGDIRQMLEAAERDRRAVLALLTRLDAQDALQSHRASPARRDRSPVPVPVPATLPVAAAAHSTLRAI